MKILRNIQVPTGNICVMQGERGKLEFLSIGDYGKDSNIKADFLGITRELNGVPNGEIMPLSEKWVITISTQYGCSMGCKFCDVPLVGKGKNATLSDLTDQLIEGIKLHPEITATKRLNIHFARMGEPTFNSRVFTAARRMKTIVKEKGLMCDTIHPVVSTMMPRSNRSLYKFLYEWCTYIKNKHYGGEAGLQMSINSTNEEQRKVMFSNNSLTLKEISHIASLLPKPIGRKYALNFALADGYEIDAIKLRGLFNPENFMVKITPIHKTHSSETNGINTSNGYQEFTPYQKAERDLINVGFDVIVFIPSNDEDLGMITCGNAILSGRNPLVPYKEL